MKNVLAFLQLLPTLCMCSIVSRKVFNFICNIYLQRMSSNIDYEKRDDYALLNVKHHKIDPSSCIGKLACPITQIYTCHAKIGKYTPDHLNKDITPTSSFQNSKILESSESNINDEDYSLNNRDRESNFNDVLKDVNKGEGVCVHDESDQIDNKNSPSSTVTNDIEEQSLEALVVNQTEDKLSSATQTLSSLSDSSARLDMLSSNYNELENCDPASVNPVFTEEKGTHEFNHLKRDEASETNVLSHTPQVSREPGRIKLTNSKTQCYTQEFRLKVIEYSYFHSQKATASKFGIPKGTVSYWRSTVKHKEPLMNPGVSKGDSLSNIKPFNEMQAENEADQIKSSIVKKQFETATTSNYSRKDQTYPHTLKTINVSRSSLMRWKAKKEHSSDESSVSNEDSFSDEDSLGVEKRKRRIVETTGFSDEDDVNILGVSRKRKRRESGENKYIL